MTAYVLIQEGTRQQEELRALIRRAGAILTHERATISRLHAETARLRAEQA